MQDKYVVERHWHYSNSRIGSGGFMPQLYYHVLAATLYLYVVDTHVSKKFVFISAGCHVVSRCTSLLPRRSQVIGQFWHAWQVTLASLVTLCYAMSCYRHVVASLSPHRPTLCFVVATQQPRVSFVVYKPSDTRLILAHNRARSYTFLRRHSHVVLRHVTL